MLKTWLRELLRAFGAVLRRVLGPDYIRKILNGWAAAMPTNEEVFLTYHLRPKRSVNVQSTSDTIANLPRVVAVLQGPIVIQDDFTLETLKIYRRHFGGSHIILSTWSDEPPAAIAACESLGVEVVVNERPAYAGESNINLQIVSSRNGVARARERGAEYVMKTRTDQRMYAPNILEYLRNIVQLFPARDAAGRQRQRIVGTSLNSFRYRMYGLSDMLTFGHIDDMVLFWSADLDQRVFTAEYRRRQTATLRGFAEMRVCEVYLVTEFLKKIGRDVTWSLRDSWSALADHFCVVDKEQLDLYWPKYQSAEYRNLTYEGSISTFEELTFREWLNLYVNLGGREIPEAVLEEPFYTG